MLATTPDIKKQRGIRLQKLIQMTGLTVTEFAMKYSIGESTIHQWQQGRLNGLSQKGAYKIIQMIRLEGIACHTRWILEGTGQEPQYFDVRSYTNNTSLQPSETHQHDLDKIYHECDTFLNQYPQAATFKMLDNSMEPHFKKGCYVGGIWEKHDSKRILGKYCIVKLASEHVLVRHVIASNQANRFHLSIANIHTAHTQPVLQDMKIIAAAPIVRQWTPQVLLDLEDIIR